jgi:hypothetical protein
MFRHISEHLSAIPRNFYKYVFTVDFMRSPQAIPAADEIAKDRDVFLEDVNSLYNIPKTAMTLVVGTPDVIERIVRGIMVMVF